ncbi:MAG: 3-hydroxyacyl-ACP dehydratase FabZ [Armatimonadota bacterium]|nr:3-hydroxyacyl-ACP dehydratase FabZ [Armatimonadota bacterium]
MQEVKEMVESKQHEAVSGAPLFDIEQLREILPHRYPFLLVDKILELEPVKRCVGVKNVTANEKFFNGHFPGHAIMPGALIVEAIAQVGCVMLLTMDEGRGRLAYFAAMDRVRFSKPVFPGDTLIIECEAVGYRRGIGKVRGVAKVDGAVVCEGEFTCALVDREREKAANNER